LDRRDEIIDDVAYGRLTPEAAEAEAARLGLEPFERTPDPAEFDPMAEVNWTLPMAMAWIAQRTPEAVRDAWDKYAGKCWFWRWRQWRVGPDGPINEGWFLEQRSTPTSTGLELLEVLSRLEDEGGQAPLMTAKEARDALWDALGAGMLPATGMPRRGGRSTIPAGEWAELLPVHSDHRDEVGVGGARLDYAEPWVPSAAVRHLWGPRQTPLALPPPSPPLGDGYMPLFDAAHWIASRGGTITIDANDESVWRAAFGLLLGALASEKVRVVGVRAGLTEPMPGHLFAGIRVDYPYTAPSLDLILSETAYLRSYPFVDDEHWRKGFDDALVSRHKDHWKQIMVEKGDIRARWPFEIGDDPDAGTETGYPGRPAKAKHLIDAEFARRADEGILGITLKDEAEALYAWLTANHPNVARPTVPTIENNIRSTYRQRRWPTK
jgi:hypothetical protein